jgi:DNA-binding beta-propeller fold protein YncE
MTPNYETTLSVIDLATFSETKRIEVAQNLHRVEADKHGTLWVSSRGDYLEEPSRLHWIDTQTDTYGGSLDITVSEMTIVGDSLYLLGSSFNYNTYQEGVSYGIVDVTKREIISHNFISDGTEAEIQMPYGLMVHPITKDIYLTDAANKVYPGTLFCFNKDGEKQWEKRAGDVPAHFAILYR